MIKFKTFLEGLDQHHNNYRELGYKPEHFKTKSAHEVKIGDIIHDRRYNPDKPGEMTHDDLHYVNGVKKIEQPVNKQGYRMQGKDKYQYSTINLSRDNQRDVITRDEGDKVNHIGSEHIWDMHKPLKDRSYIKK